MHSKKVHAQTSLTDSLPISIDFNKQFNCFKFFLKKKISESPNSRTKFRAKESIHDRRDRRKGRIKYLGFEYFLSTGLLD